MPYRLISAGKPPVIHDYTSSYWGHSITTHSKVDKLYKDLQTHQIHCSIFSDKTLRVGDLIARSMQSGKTGLYEIQTLDRYRDPSDMYSMDMVFCGYLTSDGLDIADGYGITNNLVQEINWTIRDWKFLKSVRKFLGLKK